MLIRKKTNISAIFISLFAMSFLTAQNKDQDKNLTIVLDMYNEVFKKADRNNDSQLNKEEVTILRHEIKQFITTVMTRVTEDKNGKREIHEPPAQQIHQFADKLVDAADLDKNGELSTSELSLIRKGIKQLLKLPD